MTYCPRCKKWRKSSKRLGIASLVNGRPRSHYNCRKCMLIYIPDGRKSVPA